MQREQQSKLPATANASIDPNQSHSVARLCSTTTAKVISVEGVALVSRRLPCPDYGKVEIAAETAEGLVLAMHYGRSRRR